MDVPNMKFTLAGNLEELKAKGRLVVHGARRPILVVHDRGRVFALDNRCPHMGFPLDRGSVEDGILTCHWHHAQFDLESGCTFDLWADDTPTCPVEVRDGEVWVKTTFGHSDPAAHWRQRLADGLAHDIGLVIAKAVQGQLAAGVPKADILRQAALYGAQNRDGWSVDFTILTALGNLLPALPEEETYLALFHGARRVAADCDGQAPRRERAPLASRPEPAVLKRWLRRWIKVRHREAAERTLLTGIAVEFHCWPIAKLRRAPRINDRISALDLAIRRLVADPLGELIAKPARRRQASFRSYRSRFDIRVARGGKTNDPANRMKPTSEPSTQEVLAGLVERVTFHNAENGFCVLKTKARGHRDLVTVVGQAATISAGEWITASGEWVNDRAYGQQFKARFLKTSAPTSIEGIEKYLGSGMIRGIGPAYAKNLVRAFGEKVFDTIEAEPDRLREVTGIGPVRAKRITDAWAEQKVVREIMVFLHQNGVGTARAVRIYKTYGLDAVQVMTENPYRLTRDVRGIGFKTADAIAMKLGIEKSAMIRLRAGISFALAEAMDEGHCGLPTEKLIPLAKDLLEEPEELIVTALDLERSDGYVVADKVAETPCTFLAGLYRAEQYIADRLIKIANGRLPWPWIDEEKALPWIEKRSGLQLAESQKAAIRLALTAKVLVITGGPGVGKTTIVNSILGILSAKGVELLLCAPTGRAAKRMTEAAGVEAKTIHRLLEVDPKSGGFKRNEGNALECDLLVVDETSMVDVMLMQALMRAVPDHAALLIVGDIDQLPSVGPGQVLADIIGSGAVPVVRLTEVFRQAAASGIIVNAHRINQG